MVLEFFHCTFFLLVCLTVVFNFRGYRKLSKFVFKTTLHVFDSFPLAFHSMDNPIVLFFGTILTFVFLEKNKEWTALQACSISPWWISNSMIFASILASGIPLFKMNSNLFSKGFINYPENNNLVIKNSNHETWYFESFDEKKMRGENIQIYVDNDKGDSAYRLRCRSATWSPITGWTFYDGMFLSFLTEKGVPMPNFEKKKIEWTPKKIVPWQQDIETENSPVRKVLFSELIISLDENQTHLLVMKDPISYLNEYSNFDYPNQNSLTSPFVFSTQWPIRIIKSHNYSWLHYFV